MINYDSILSAFDGKPTLLQWLKMVKKALDESVLKDITLNQDGANAIFTFNFEDGTSISTPAVTLPKGETGAKGDKGDKGEQGVSVTAVDEVSNEVVGGQTLTTLRFNFSNGTNNEVVVHAENGKNASGVKLYLHNIQIYDEVRTTTTFLIIYSLSATPFTFSTLSNKIVAQKNGEVPFSGYVNFPISNKTRSLLYIECDSRNMVGWANSDDFSNILVTAFGVDMLNLGNSTLTDTVTEL